MTKIERWVVFFALGNRPEYSEIIAEITKQQEGIAVANEILLNSIWFLRSRRLQRKL